MRNQATFCQELRYTLQGGIIHPKTGMAERGLSGPFRVEKTLRYPTVWPRILSGIRLAHR